MTRQIVRAVFCVGLVGLSIGAERAVAGSSRSVLVVVERPVSVPDEATGESIYNSHAPYPPFSFRYSSAVRPAGDAIMALMFMNVTTKKLAFYVIVQPAQATTRDEELRQRKLERLDEATPRRIAGYEAVKVKALKGVYWAFLTTPTRGFGDRRGKRAEMSRLFIALRDDETIVRSFRFGKMGSRRESRRSSQPD
jgi:hypothetical protein